MKKPRFQTDFLVARSSFATGFGQVLDIWGSGPIYNRTGNPDETAVAMDWAATWQDIEDVLANEREDRP